jgi:heterokaryon incompatibility protein (HET)
MQPYRYTPLPESGTIRLLRLLPQINEDAPIECLLFDFALDSFDQGTHLYDALSYVWGASDKPLKVTVNNMYHLPVTVNLHSALLHLRDRYFERVLWIDAICINQESLAERGHQVQFMARIYGKANSVIIWLGEAADNSDQAIEEIREAADEELKKLPRDEQAILSLLKRPWFRRIWVSGPISNKN